MYVMGAERCTWKYADFHKSLSKRGVVRPFLGSEDVSIVELTFARMSKCRPWHGPGLALCWFFLSV